MARILPQAGEPAILAPDPALYLTFSLHGELYALDIVDVAEIIAWRSLTAVPMTPPVIRGVTNLRGRVLPVIDLAARFGWEPTTVGRRTAIIVLGAAGRGVPQPLGIMVDGAHKVVPLGATDLLPPPEFGAGINPDFIGGMASYQDDFVILLDTRSLLTLDVLRIDRELTWPPPPDAA